MDKDKLRQVIIDQRRSFQDIRELVERDTPLDYYLKGDEVVIISGIRRCGKSSLLKLIAKQIEGAKIFVSFDDVRLADFDADNFQDIQDLAMEIVEDGAKASYFLDEAQNAPHWERWVNNLHSRGIKVFVTGSNSTLLSSEISTLLTGRNKVLQLSPFSFKEYLKLKGAAVPALTRATSEEKSGLYKNFLDYLEEGGFPCIIKNNDLELSRQYFEDILNRDIVNRYRIKEIKELKDLILFLFSNIGKTYSYSTLKEVSSIKSFSTIKNYIDCLQNVFLLYTIQRFDYSIKKQKVSSSKPYVGDNSFLKTVAFNFSENKGRRLENLVFTHLMRKGLHVYYHLRTGECDFVIKENLKITQAIQVTLGLSHPTSRKREISGLSDAMNSYKLKEGIILTLEDEETIKIKDQTIIVKPVWKWMLE